MLRTPLWNHLYSLFLTRRNWRKELSEGGGVIYVGTANDAGAGIYGQISVSKLKFIVK